MKGKAVLTEYKNQFLDVCKRLEYTVLGCNGDSFKNYLEKTIITDGEQYLHKDDAHKYGYDIISYDDFIKENDYYNKLIGLFVEKDNVKFEVYYVGMSMIYLKQVVGNKTEKVLFKNINNYKLSEL